MSFLRERRKRYFPHLPYLSPKIEISENHWFDMDPWSSGYVRIIIFWYLKTFKGEWMIGTGSDDRTMKEDTSWSKLQFYNSWTFSEPGWAPPKRGYNRKYWKGSHPRSLSRGMRESLRVEWTTGIHLLRSHTWPVRRVSTSGNYKGTILSNVYLRGGHKRSLQKS